jgi:hypothetical protein
MREPLGRHDGVASARRAFDDHQLMTAARSAPGLTPLLYRPVHHTNPLCASVRPLVGIRAEHKSRLVTALASNASHLVADPRPGRRPW